MDIEFWVYCWKQGPPNAKDYVWSRMDIAKEDRKRSDEAFLRSRLGKSMRVKLWRRAYSDCEDDEAPRDEVDVLQRCIRDVKEELCAAPSSTLLKRALESYSARLEDARAKKPKGSP
ncbi:hypothetical protein GN244_ATG15250 [Phytophthora infestans]|uniref:Uncharacterized protein n=1 Tax=Phytophthora infestans TaxID=4787 RepID=A0A833SJB3_PHYIN|nr:hypothetical protein GN244_ATG15250 [Phytophthora infestans]KAF4129698.1 hypothetical protein GN958_ATG21193 [Phytophthora infestans]